MLTLLKKELTNLGVILLFVSLGILMVVAVYIVITGRDLERSPLSVIDFIFIIEGMAVFGLPMGNEKYEEKNRGYHFLGTLPVEKREIVKAKFLAFLLPGVITAFAIWLAYFIILGGIYSKIVLGAVSLAFSFGILVGILYVFIFKLEYSVMFVPTILTYMLVLSFPMWSNLLFKKAMNFSEVDLINFYTGSIPFVALAVSLTCLYLLFKKTVKEFSKKEF
ncbi:ABC-2 transporter permease [Kosmotoga pacifica]|uniref:ABC-2 family transporter protein n=1 Tax=Kosmotoga pacifica TaxID=1330330 RepID=A0A0G2Z8U5_9BACT|nr:ABC-2 transporter permease [Kosmotoga pacifica]AKI97982.1 hypothetical protein IX53_09275 [Kosmotoga pacifica]